MSGTERTAYRTCPLCEATCGLELRVVDERVTRIRGDRDDVFSHGYVCPKGSTLRQLHEDPDRLRRPLVRRDGELVEVSWDEAFAEVERLLAPLLAEHGRDVVATYLGNPNSHNLAGTLYLKPLLRALGSRNVFSASTVDQRPKELANAWLFGGSLTLALPDLDRTDLLLILGANPYASNGSLATAPDWPGRIEAIRERGGKVVVVDPRRSRTAEEADVHLAIRPGTDALLLAAVVTTLAETDRIDAGPAGEWVRGIAEVVEALAPFTAEAVAASVGIGADQIRELARDLADAPRAVAYGRIGTTTAEFGTLASWLVDVVNVVTGNLDRPGGAMFNRAAAASSNTRGAPRFGRGIRVGRHQSRVRGLAESLGELPVSCLAEEIDTPGEGQVRALVTVAGNPVLSTPNSGRLDAALGLLDCYVAVDIYLNETTRHADVVLPPPSALQKVHYDVVFNQLAIRNVANWSPAVLPLDDGQPDEWQILAKLALIAQGLGAGADPALVDDLVASTLAQQAVADEHGPVHGRTAEELLEGVAPRTGPARLVDLLVRTGPYGDAFGARTDDVAPGVPPLSLDVLEARPHGVDLGPMAPRLPDVLRTPSGLVELDAEPFLADLPRLLAALDRPVPDAVLVGRRDLRSNNSWMHNVEVLVKGRPRCTLHVHPTDAERWGLVDGELATLSGRVGSLEAPVEVTDGVRPGVVSLPHGWGHDLPGSRLGVAGRHAGVNSNVVADERLVDELSGNAVLNGIPVTVSPAGTGSPVAGAARAPVPA
ncbi:molybdopterin-dependent oxidoreductase [Aquihabitans sp. G128]|uniref:molybdopterin-dependent oxidoreductase n=1 Tax=Aquihabitans sp. G128 TaxID=2849779 RepID=UPI001C23962B|nr:molybdopterin-dependent oxidoreductase [Aquihabitans sp. G128]QXC62489.1 molybdopterin-dependent oxidoreductase [Aquihabitans sp. G128]